MSIYLQRIFVLSQLLVLGTVSFCGQNTQDRQQQIASHNRQAAQYLKQNRTDLAVAEFDAVLALDPNNVDARGNLGVILYFEGEYAKAVPQLRAALKLRPSLPKIRALLGIAEKHTGDLAAARRDLEEAFPEVQEKKVRVDAGLELIELYSATGDLDKAASTVAILKNLEPTDQIILYVAYRVYSDLENESLLSLSVVAPNSARMHQALAHELAKRGDTAVAIDNYREALKIDPQLPGLHFELAEMLRASGTVENKQEAESEYKAALVSNPFDEQSDCRLGEIALQANDIEAASGYYTRAVELRPDDPEANIGLAKVMMSMNQTEKAEKLLQHALQLDPTNSTAHFRLSTVYRQTGRPEQAKQEVEEYKKYKEMKEKLRAVYHDLHRGDSPGAGPDGSSKP